MVRGFIANVLEESSRVIFGWYPRFEGRSVESPWVGIGSFKSYLALYSQVLFLRPLKSYSKVSGAFVCNELSRGSTQCCATSWFAFLIISWKLR